LLHNRSTNRIQKDCEIVNIPLNNPKAIAEAGERLYAERFKADLEANSVGKYAVIDVTAERVTVGETPELAFEEAKKNAPTGVFHLIRIGFPGAFQASYQYRHGTQDWLFG
jgi:hypothetical protein